MGRAPVGAARQITCGSDQCPLTRPQWTAGHRLYWRRRPEETWPATIEWHGLIGFWYCKTENATAGRKAFVVTRIGDLFFTIGVLWLFALLGTIGIFALTTHAFLSRRATDFVVELETLITDVADTAEDQGRSWHEPESVQVLSS